MSRALMPRRLLLAVLLVALTALALLGQSFRVFDRAWFAVQERRHADVWKECLIWLLDYRMRIETQPVEGLSDGVSMLTFDPDRRILLTVTNQLAQIIELSLQDKVLRTISLTGFSGAETIEYISRGVYVITGERQQYLVKVRLEDDTCSIDAANAQQLPLGIGLNGNKGLKRLVYDVEGEHLSVAKGRDPARVCEIHGLLHTQVDKSLAVHVVDNPGRDKRLFVRDLSSLQFDGGTGYLLASFDESRLVVELDTDSEPVSTLLLLRGVYGLKRSVPQAEGVAMDDRGILYLVSEPNLFYVFSKDKPA